MMNERCPANAHNLTMISHSASAHNLTTFSNWTLSSYDWLVDSSPYSAIRESQLYRVNAGYLSPSDDDGDGDECSILPSGVPLPPPRLFADCTYLPTDLRPRRKFRLDFHHLAKTLGLHLSQFLRSFRTVLSTLPLHAKNLVERKSLDRLFVLNIRLTASTFAFRPVSAKRPNFKVTATPFLFSPPPSILTVSRFTNLGVPTGVSKFSSSLLPGNPRRRARRQSFRRFHPAGIDNTDAVSIFSRQAPPRLPRARIRRGQRRRSPTTRRSRIFFLLSESPCRYYQCYCCFSPSSSSSSFSLFFSFPQ